MPPMYTHHHEPGHTRAGWEQRDAGGKLGHRGAGRAGTEWGKLGHLDPGMFNGRRGRGSETPHKFAIELAPPGHSA